MVALQSEISDLAQKSNKNITQKTWYCFLEKAGKILENH